MSMHQGSEGGLIAMIDEVAQQFTIAETSASGWERLPAKVLQDPVELGGWHSRSLE
jgi:hypothetical protein